MSDSPENEKLTPSADSPAGSSFSSAEDRALDSGFSGESPLHSDSPAGSLDLGEAPPTFQKRVLQTLRASLTKSAQSLRNFWVLVFLPRWASAQRSIADKSQSLALRYPALKKILPSSSGKGGFKNKELLRTSGDLLTLLLCCYFLADLLAIALGRFIPDAPIVRAPRTGGSASLQKTLESYSIIFTRNLFNHEGKIPGESDPGQMSDPGGAPIKTSLPFNLIGTVILEDELRSIATIEDKTANAVYPVRVQDEIPLKAKIVEVSENRVVFLNMQSGRREYIELPQEAAGAAISIAPKSSLTAAAAAPGTTIEKLSPTHFSISRVEVDKTLADLNRVLTEARAVPNIENGVPNGYKLFQIVPGSIYDKLGLKNGDVIVGLNGEAVNDPAKAMSLLTELKTSNSLSLDVKQGGGRKLQYQYDIR